MKVLISSEVVQHFFNLLSTAEFSGLYCQHRLRVQKLESLQPITPVSWKNWMDGENL